MLQQNTMGPTEQQLEQYHREGYVGVDDLIPEENVVALRRRVREYTHGGRDIGNIKVQVEPRISRGEMRVEHPGDGIRKLEGLVQNDDLFAELGTHERIVTIMEQVLGPDIKMFRNSLLLKPPEVGSAKGMHQDAPYWPIEPMNECSCWFAIDDATPENGCMGVIPGRHTEGALPHRHITDDYVIDESEYSMDDLVLAPVKAGGGLIFHALAPHYTAPNRSNAWRRAIALSYMSAKSKFTGEGAGPEYFHIKGSTYAGCVR